MTLLLCLAIISGTLTLRQVNEQLKGHQAELDRTRRELEDLRQKLTGLSRAESTSLERLETLQEQISVADRYVVQLDAQANARTDEIAAATRSIDSTAGLLDVRKADLAARLVAIYKYGRLLPLQAVLASGSPAGLYRRLYYLRWLARADHRLSSDLAVLKSELAAQRAQLLSARADLERLRDERVSEGRRIQSARQSEAALHARLRSEQEAQRRMAEDLAAAVARLQDLIQSLEKHRLTLQEPTEDHHFNVNKGRLAWPVRGEVIASFGAQVHPRYKTKTENNGIDIASAVGGPAGAIADGKVAYADQFLGYGRLVILDHGGGFYTLYGNLAAVEVTVGEAVPAGRSVGSTKDYLHFEIRRSGQPVDPLEWLRPQE